MFLKRIYALGVAASVLSGAIAKPHRKLQDAYEVEVTEIALFDVDTQIPDIVAVHNGECSLIKICKRPCPFINIYSCVMCYQTGALFNVSASLEWAENIIVEGSSNTLTYETTIDGEVIDTGSIDLNASRDLPTTIECGQGTMDASGKHTVSVKVTIDDSSSENSRDYQSFAAGVSFIPLILVLVIAGTTHMVS
jgi:hypothetical protein